MVSQNPGILFTAFLVPSNKDEFASYRKDPNFSVMACQEESDEIASHFANRLVGELVPLEFVRTLCCQTPGAIDAGAVVADFGHGSFTVFAFHDGPFPNIKDLPKLNIVLSIAPQSVEDPSTLPIVAAGQGVFNLMRSLRSFNATVYVKTTTQLIWTLDTNMPDSVNKVSRIVRVHNNGNNSVASSEPLKQEQMSIPTMSFPPTESPPLILVKNDAKVTSPKRKRIIKVGREALILGKRAKFSKEETAWLEEAFLENFRHDENENKIDSSSSPQTPKAPKTDGVTNSVPKNMESDMKEKVKEDEGKVAKKGQEKNEIQDECAKKVTLKDILQDVNKADKTNEVKYEEKIEVKVAKNDTMTDTKKNEIIDLSKGAKKDSVMDTVKDDLKSAKKNTVTEKAKDAKKDTSIVVKEPVIEKGDPKSSKRKEKALTKKEMKDLQTAMDILTNLENM